MPVSDEDRSQIERIAEAMSLGSYQLVLGAGASHGTSNSRGALPMAAQLTTEILEELGYADDRISLARAYETLHEVRGEHFALEFLKERYSGCSPREWHFRMAERPWQAIWTFNVDDIVEHAFAGSDTDYQTLIPSDPLVPLQSSLEYVPIIHVHGYVGLLSPKPEPAVVFSIPQYASVARSSMQANWHSTFRTSLPTSPLVVVGAQLSEEADIAEVLRQGNRTVDWGLPSCIVRPGITDFEADEYRRWGFIPIRATAEEFFACVDEFSEHAPVAGPYESRHTRSTLIALDQFAPPDSRHDFYIGHHPHIDDITSGLDGIPNWVSTLVENIGSATQRQNTRTVHLVSGSAFSGKSTALLRIGRELQLRGWGVRILGGEESLKPDELLKFLAERPPTVLLVDNAASEATDIQRAVDLFEDQAQPLTIVAAERSGWATRSLINTIGERNIAGSHEAIFVEPTQSLWTKIANIRDGHARMGALDGASDMAVQKHFIEQKQDLFSSLASLEDGSGFISRITSAVGNFDRREAEVLAVVSLASHAGHSVSTAIVCLSVGIKHNDLATKIDGSGDLGHWIQRDPSVTSHLRLRHKYIGDLLVDGRLKNLPVDDLGSIMSEMCNLLAEQVDSPAVIGQGTHEARLVGSLMNRHTVTRVVPAENVDAWYQALQDSYSWNARYWEQRALAISADLPAMHPFVNYEKAYSFAERAVSIYSDEKSQNTLGTILMRRSLATMGSGDDGQAISYWRKACTALRMSRETKRRVEHPYRTFLSYTKRLLKLMPAESVFRTEVRTEVAFWIEGVSKLPDANSRSFQDLSADLKSELAEG